MDAKVATNGLVIGGKASSVSEYSDNISIRVDHEYRYS